MYAVMSLLYMHSCGLADEVARQEVREPQHNLHSVGEQRAQRRPVWDLLKPKIVSSTCCHRELLMRTDVAPSLLKFIYACWKLGIIGGHR